MKLPRLALAGLALATASLATAQEIDREAAKRELDAIFERPAGQRVDTQAALAAFSEFFEKYPEDKLGPLGYAVALRSYFARDYEEATEALDRFFASYRGIDDPEYRKMAGRIYLAALARALRDDPVDRELILRRATWALQLYDDQKMVLRFVAAAINDGRLKEPAKVRTPLARWLVQSVAEDAELDAALDTLYAADVQMAAAGPRRVRAAAAQPAEPAPATRARPAELKPFRAKAMSGKTIDLADYKGKVVLVDFWATWCGPCIREMPNVVKVYEKYHGKGLEVIGVSLDKEGAEEKIEATAAKLGMTWEQIYDGGYWKAELAVENGIRSIPFTFLLDREGKVRHTRLRGEDLEKAVAELIAEKR